MGATAGRGNAAYRGCTGGPVAAFGRLTKGSGLDLPAQQSACVHTPVACRPAQGSDSWQERRSVLKLYRKGGVACTAESCIEMHPAPRWAHVSGRWGAMSDRKSCK